jgi:hypothetical protein
MLKKTIKRKFSPDEDKKLLELVKAFGTSDWITIKQYFKDRTTRQLKDRWRLYLDPQINQEIWTNEEDQLLIEKQKQFGNSWKAIQQEYFPSRTDRSIRNRFVKIKMKKSPIDPLEYWVEDLSSSDRYLFLSFE